MYLRNLVQNPEIASHEKGVSVYKLPVVIMNLKKKLSLLFQTAWITTKTMLDL